MVMVADFTVESVRSIALDTYEMKLMNQEVSEQVKAGQFLHIHIPNYTLRRPISIADVEENGVITIIFKAIGDGTSELVNYKQGDRLNALAPCGNGFSIADKHNETVVLVGGGVGVPPLHYLGRKLKEQNNKVITIIGFQSKEHVFYEEEFKVFSDETIVVTDDGSYGEKGFVTDALKKVASFDTYYSCGPFPMLKAVSEQQADKEGFISLEERMGCGVGACFACVIPTHEENGYKKICQDGPVFSAQEVVLP